MSIQKLGHYSIRTTDLDASRKFYAELFGLKEGFRPPFDFPGAWLYRGGDESDFGVVHLIGIDPNDSTGLVAYLGDRQVASLAGSGAVDHIAFLADDLANMRARLQALAVPFTERSVPSLGLHQMFVTDPSGLTIEVNFPAAEAVALGLGAGSAA
jgi:catechol 2,3-dioxygenase-like lactoylglutathione lyase family enzyme